MLKWKNCLNRVKDSSWTNNLYEIIDLLDCAAGFLFEQIQSSQIYSLFQKSLANFFVQLFPRECIVNAWSACCFSYTHIRLLTSWLEQSKHNTNSIHYNLTVQSEIHFRRAADFHVLGKLPLVAGWLSPLRVTMNEDWAMDTACSVTSKRAKAQSCPAVLSLTNAHHSLQQGEASTEFYLWLYLAWKTDT